MIQASTPFYGCVRLGGLHRTRGFFAFAVAFSLATLSLTACSKSSDDATVCGVKVSTLARFTETTNVGSVTKMPTKAEPHAMLNTCNIYSGNHKIAGVTVGSFPGSGLAANERKAIDSQRALARRCAHLSISHTGRSETEVCRQSSSNTLVIMVTADLDINVQLHSPGRSITDTQARAVTASIDDYWNGRG